MVLKRIEFIYDMFIEMNKHLKASGLDTTPFSDEEYYADALYNMSTDYLKTPGQDDGDFLMHICEMRATQLHKHANYIMLKNSMQIIC